MLVYKAMYKYLDQGVHAEVLDFPLEEPIYLLMQAASQADWVPHNVVPW